MAEPLEQRPEPPQHVPTGRLADLVARAERLRVASEEHLSSLHVPGEHAEPHERAD